MLLSAHRRRAEDGELTPDENELVYFYREIEHKPLQLIALNQVRTLAESAIEADMETERRSLEHTGLMTSDDRGQVVQCVLRDLVQSRTLSDTDNGFD